LNTRNTKLDPLDLFDIRSELTEDELMVRDSVARFVDEQAIPPMREAFEQHYFPEELIAQVAELGLFGSSIEGWNSSAATVGCAALFPCKAAS
jgi:glutaryl-CoA dehydrogenase